MSVIPPPSRTSLRVIAFGLSLGVATACTAAAPSQAPILTEQTPGAALQTRVGVPVEIRLRTQPGTGFSWFPKSFAADLTPMEPIRGQSIPGGWQIQRFRFAAKHVGTYHLTFSYDRPWAGGTKGARLETFTIIVR